MKTFTATIVSICTFSLASQLMAGFVETKQAGAWSDPNVWNWRNMTTEAPQYPNTSDTTQITHGTIKNDVVVDLDVTMPLLFVSSRVTLSEGKTLTLTGYNNNFLNMQSGSVLDIVNGKVAIVNTPNSLNFDSKNVSVSFEFGGYDADGNFHAAESGAFDIKFSADNGWVGFQSSDENSHLKYYLDNSNLSKEKLTNSGIVNIQTGKLGYLNSAVMLDLSNVNTSELDLGTYYVSLISYAAYYTGNIQAEKINVTATLAKGMEFLGLEMDGNSLYAKIQVNSVPEPATYAALFGAFALLIAFRNRRK